MIRYGSGSPDLQTGGSLRIMLYPWRLTRSLRSMARLWNLQVHKTADNCVGCPQLRCLSTTTSIAMWQLRRWGSRPAHSRSMTGRFDGESPTHTTEAGTGTTPQIWGRDPGLLLPIMPPYGSLLLQRWSSPGVYEVRGAVRDVALNHSAEIVWNAPNSAFLWCEIDSDASTRVACDHTPTSSHYG